MYGPRPIRFPTHWCVDYSKYRGFLAGGISTASSLLPFFGTRLRRQNFNLAPTQYRQLRRLIRHWTQGWINTEIMQNCFEINWAFKLIFFKCIFEFMINTVLPTSNSVHVREKCFKYNNCSITIIQWLHGTVCKGSNFTCGRLRGREF